MKENIQYSNHFKEMLIERAIKEEWAHAALSLPDKTERRPDGTIHYMKRIREYGNRWLRVIVKPTQKQRIAITVFFDRRIRRKK